MLRMNACIADLFKVIFIGWVILVISGCSPLTPSLPPLETANVPETQAAPISPTEGATTQMPPSLPTTVEPNLQNLIDKAIADLAQRLSISADEIILLEATNVVWPDSSLGCPQEGMAYAQVLTPGYLILLEYSRNKYEYHAGKDTSITYCKNPAPPISGTPENT